MQPGGERIEHGLGVERVGHGDDDRVERLGHQLGGGGVAGHSVALADGRTDDHGGVGHSHQVVQRAQVKQVGDVLDLGDHPRADNAHAQPLSHPRRP